MKKYLIFYVQLVFSTSIFDWLLKQNIENEALLIKLSSFAAILCKDKNFSVSHFNSIFINL